MKEYLQYSNNYNHQLDGLVPITTAFNQKWKQLAASDPEFANHNTVLLRPSIISHN